MGATPATEESWALGLPPTFDECVLPELSLDGRLVYSTSGGSIGVFGRARAARAVGPLSTGVDSACEMPQRGSGPWISFRGLAGTRDSDLVQLWASTPLSLSHAVCL